MTGAQWSVWLKKFWRKFARNIIAICRRRQLTCWHRGVRVIPNPVFWARSAVILIVFTKLGFYPGSKILGTNLIPTAQHLLANRIEMTREGIGEMGN